MWIHLRPEQFELRSALLGFDQAKPQLTFHAIAHLLYADIEQAPTDENGRPFVKKAEFDGRDKENFLFQWENVVKEKNESGLQESGRQANDGYNRNYYPISILLI